MSDDEYVWTEPMSTKIVKINDLSVKSLYSFGIFTLCPLWFLVQHMHRKFRFFCFFVNPTVNKLLQIVYYLSQQVINQII